MLPSSQLRPGDNFTSTYLSFLIMLCLSDCWGPAAARLRASLSSRKGKQLNAAQGGGDLRLPDGRVSLRQGKGRTATRGGRKKQPPPPGAPLAGLNKAPLAPQTAGSWGTIRARIPAARELQSKYIAEHLHNLFLCEEFNLSAPIINS